MYYRRPAIDRMAGGGRGRAGLMAAVVLGLVAVVAPAAGRAAGSTWTISLTPSTITASQTTTISATFSNLGGADGQTELGCVRIAIPTTFTVGTVAVTSDPPRTTWHASKAGLTTVTVKAGSGGDRLPADDPSVSVTAAITVTAVLPGTYAWTANAFRAQDCKAPFNDPVALNVIVDLAILPLPTPKPSPTILPTARPTVLPTALPTLIPTPRPTARPTPTPIATGTPAPTPTPTRSPEPADPSATPPPAGGTSDPGATPAGPAPQGSSAPDRIPIGSEAPLGAALLMPSAGPGGGGSGAAGPAIRLTSGFDTPFGEGFAWAVPGLVLTVPGLLIVLAAIAAQAVGAVAWLPVVRRRIGAFGLRGRDARRDAQPGGPAGGPAPDGADGVQIRP